MVGELFLHAARICSGQCLQSEFVQVSQNLDEGDLMVLFYYYLIGLLVSLLNPSNSLYVVSFSFSIYIFYIE